MVFQLLMPDPLTMSASTSLPMYMVSAPEGSTFILGRYSVKGRLKPMCSLWPSHRGMSVEKPMPEPSTLLNTPPFGPVPALRGCSVAARTDTSREVKD